VTLTPASPALTASGASERLQAAGAAGRRMAAQILTPAAAAADSPVEAMARASVPHLREMGVVAEIVRARRDCLVVRSVARDPVAAAEACALVGGWLEALPGVAYGLAGTVAESTCVTRGSQKCIHTLMWRTPADATVPPIAVELPSTLGSPTEGPPPSGPSPDEGPSPSGPSSTEGSPSAWGPSPAGGAPPEPSPDAASPIPFPIPAAFGLAPAAPPPPSPARLEAASASAFAPLQLGPGQAHGVTGGAAGCRSPADGKPRPATGGSGYAGTVYGLPTGTAGGQTAGGQTGGRRTAYGGVAQDVRVPPVGSASPTSAAGHPRRRFSSRSSRFGRWPWVRRRAWLLALGLVAGAVGGDVAGAHGASSYAATAVLEVQSSASTNAVSSANGAEELAVTYAALIPTDEALLARVGAEVGVGTSALGHHLSVEAVSGTALIDVRYASGTSSGAVRGADDVAHALTTSPPGHAITPGSLSLVSTARSAARGGSLHRYGLPIGVLLGLVVGAGTALVAERTDRRVDDVDGLSAAAGCSATSEPGGISASELAAALTTTGEEPVVFVPLSPGEESAAAALAVRVAQARTRPGPRAGNADASGTAAPAVTVSAPFTTSPQQSSGRSGTSVLVVAAGQRAASVQEAAERLRLLGRGPTWAVLVPRAGRDASRGHGA
jgi:capsular polysaccharide biosynthesis protein